jgi:hypothetical protein
MVTLDAFCERTRVDSILTGDSDAGHSWRDGLERIVRALVVLPADEDKASAEPV